MHVTCLHANIMPPPGRAQVMNGPDQVPLKVVKREITLSSSIQHDNIVRLLDVFAEKHQLVIVVRGSCYSLLPTWVEHHRMRPDHPPGRGSGFWVTRQGALALAAVWWLIGGTPQHDLAV